MQPVFPPPPLSRWGLIWRIALVLLISGVAWAELAVWQWNNNRVWFAIDSALGVMSFALVFWRRKWPVPVAVVTNLACAASGAAGGPATLTLFSLATRRRWREIIPASAAALIAGVALEQYSPLAVDVRWLTELVVLAIVGVTVGWGMYVGSRRELLAALRDRAARAESQQATREARARVAERTRIAREMHDVLAHRISMITMHSGAMSFRSDLDADQLRDSARLIEENSHQAMVELREVLGVLRGAESGLGASGPIDADGCSLEADRPQPSAPELVDLVTEARASGMRLHFVTDIDLTTIPTVVGRTLYRVVQEALTNARKHAPDTRVDVLVAGSPGTEVEAIVRNPLPIGASTSPMPPSGLGLVGLAERVELAGGLLRAELTSSREFVLHVQLPWPA